MVKIILKKRALYAVTAAVVVALIVIFPAIISNIPASYTLASAKNIDPNQISPGFIDGQTNANFNFHVITVNVSGISVSYFAEYYVPFDDFCRTVNLSNFQNIGNPGISSTSTMLFTYSMICMLGSSNSGFHGTLSTSVDNIHLTGNSSATRGFPLKGPIVSVSYSPSGTPQDIIIEYLDPVVLLNNGTISFSPPLGNYSYTLSFNVLTYEEYGIYRTLESSTPVSFYFSFDVLG